MNGYRCIACNATQTADYAGFLCPGCGGNLDITYDYENARRAISTRFEGPDDIFRYAPLLPVAGGGAQRAVDYTPQPPRHLS